MPDAKISAMTDGGAAVDTDKIEISREVATVPTTYSLYLSAVRALILTLTDALEFPAEVAVASATTADIGAALSNLVRITGTTTITGFGTVASGAVRFVRFTGALTLTHNGTSLILPAGANITTADGDLAVMMSLGSGNWRCLAYHRADSGLAKLLRSGDTLTGALNYAATVDVASATTTDIGAAASNVIRVTGTTTITGLGTIAAGAVRLVRFAGALTLTHNATSLILPGGANIVTAAEDTAIFVSLGSGNWRCWSYQRASLAPVDGGAYTDYVPTVAATTPAGSGFAYTINDASYRKIGRQVHVQCHITLTNLGSGPSASGSLTVTLPFTAGAAAVGAGVETGLTNKQFSARCSAGSSIASLAFYDATSLVVVNHQLRFSMVYEADS